MPFIGCNSPSTNSLALYHEGLQYNKTTASIYAQINKLARHIVKLKAKSPDCDISKLEDEMEVYVRKLYFAK